MWGPLLHRGEEVICSNCGLVQGCAPAEGDGGDGDLARLLGTGVEQHLRHVEAMLPMPQRDSVERQRVREAVPQMRDISAETHQRFR